MLYFLKHKSDTLLATTKYLSDIAFYGHVKCLWTDNGMEFTLEPFQQFPILHIRMGLLSSHGELYFYGRVSPC